MAYDDREQSQAGGAPVELYLFACGTDAWYYTSADSDQVYGGRTYLHDVVTRGSVDESDEDQGGEIQITTMRNNEVAALFIPDLPTHPVRLSAYRFHRGDAEVVCFWTGEVASCEFKGSTALLTCLPVGAAFRRTIPSLTFQSQCNWSVYGPRCGLSQGSYRVTAVATLVSGTTIQASEFSGHASGYFRGGWVETPDGETHFVTEHVGTTLTLLTPFRTLHAGDTVYAFPGCDRTLAACTAFGNTIHFCGFPFIPTKNPFVSGIA